MAALARTIFFLAGVRQWAGLAAGLRKVEPARNALIQRAIQVDADSLFSICAGEFIKCGRASFPTVHFQRQFCTILERERFFLGRISAPMERPNTDSNQIERYLEKARWAEERAAGYAEGYYKDAWLAVAADYYDLIGNVARQQGRANVHTTVDASAVSDAVGNRARAPFQRAANDDQQSTRSQTESPVTQRHAN
jgi:hypothetical protein